MRVVHAFLVLALGAASIGSSCDPVHDDAQAALGGEAPGVPHGPLHRPGQPCITCHDGALGSPPQFSVAGTIYQNANDTIAAEGANVTLTNADGKTHYTTTTNSAGNFYLTPKDFTPVYPMRVAVEFNGTTVFMSSLVGRDGSCADCHTDPRGPTSSGHIYIPPQGITP
jgi:hypothetical protein